MDKTNNIGADASIEAIGSEEPIGECLKVTKKGGNVIWVGIGKNSIKIPFINIVCKEFRIEGVFRYANTYRQVLQLLEKSKIDFTPYVTHRFKLEDIEEAFKVANDPRIEKMKIIIEMD